MAAAKFFSCRDKSRCQFSNKGLAAHANAVEHLFDGVRECVRDDICKCLHRCFYFQFIFLSFRNSHIINNNNN